MRTCILMIQLIGICENRFELREGVLKFKQLACYAPVALVCGSNNNYLTHGIDTLFCRPPGRVSFQEVSHANTIRLYNGLYRSTVRYRNQWNGIERKTLLGIPIVHEPVR